MSTETKNLGIRKACPECHKLFIKTAELKDLTGGKIFISNNCRFCNEPITIEVGMKPYMKVYRTVKVIAVLFLILATTLSYFLLSNINAKFAYFLTNYVTDR